MSRDLAIGWFKLSRGRREYAGDADSRCAVINAAMKVEEDEWLDLTTAEANDGLVGVFVEKGYQDEEDATKLYDEYIDLVEASLGLTLKVVQTQVRPPRPAERWPKQMIGGAFCLVVRDPACINISDIELLENREI